MAAALGAVEQGAQVSLVCKEPIGYGNTRISGGIVAQPGYFPEDSCEKFIDDMAKAGGYINEPQLVRTVAKYAADANQMLEASGHLFQREDQDYAVIQPGGHGVPRTLTSYGQGIQLANALRSAVLKCNVEIVEECMVVELLKVGSVVAGALALDITTGETVIFKAAKTIIATGGAGCLLYPHTDNMLSLWGEGYALALSAGASLRDLDLIQFLPFGIVWPNGMEGIGCGEPGAAGPEGVIKDAAGQVILNRVNTLTRGELVSRMCKNLLKDKVGPHGGLYLDPTGNLETEAGVKSYRQWKEIGAYDSIKLAYGTKAYHFQEAFEVLPTQHFTLGGVVINQTGETGVTNLYAAGEVTGGIHGADRLGSVALLECMVFGFRAGGHAAKKAALVNGPDLAHLTGPQYQLKQYYGRTGSYSTIRLLKILSASLWRYYGFSSCSYSLKKLKRTTEIIKQCSENIKTSAGLTYNTEVQRLLELKKLIEVVDVIIYSLALRSKADKGSIVISKNGNELAGSLLPGSWGDEQVVHTSD